jgi:hypothetical protein
MPESLELNGPLNSFHTHAPRLSWTHDQGSNLGGLQKKIVMEVNYIYSRCHFERPDSACVVLLAIAPSFQLKHHQKVVNTRKKDFPRRQESEKRFKMDLVTRKYPTARAAYCPLPLRETSGDLKSSPDRKKRRTSIRDRLMAQRNNLSAARRNN